MATTSFGVHNVKSMKVEKTHFIAAGFKRIKISLTTSDDKVVDISIFLDGDYPDFEVPETIHETVGMKKIKAEEAD